MRPDPDCTAIDVGGAPAVVAGASCDLARALDLLALNKGAVLVLVGGAGAMDSPAGKDSLHSFFLDLLAPLAESLHAVVIDGGTDSGVMKLMGTARSAIRGTFPLLGVAAIGTIGLPGRSGKRAGTAALEGRHSHFLLVPGEDWGDESPWIARAATLLSDGQRALTLAVNGGEITLRDIAFSIRERRPVLVVSGSGRAADRVAACLKDGSGDPEIRALVTSGLIQALDIDQDRAELIRILKSRLGG